MTDAETDDQPLFTVVKGQPTDEELAALIVVFSSFSSTTGSDGRPRVPPAGRPTGDPYGDPSIPGPMPGDCRVVSDESLRRVGLE